MAKQKNLERFDAREQARLRRYIKATKKSFSLKSALEIIIRDETFAYLSNPGKTLDTLNKFQKLMQETYTQMGRLDALGKTVGIDDDGDDWLSKGDFTNALASIEKTLRDISKEVYNHLGWTERFTN